jgi:hypothetical protein
VAGMYHDPVCRAALGIESRRIQSYEPSRLAPRHHDERGAMPKLRDWMNKNSWLVNIIVYVVFILLILF